MRSLYVATAAALLLAGCGSVTHDTASGKVETSIAAPPEAVKSALANAMVNQRYRISKDSQFEIAFDKPTENLAAVAFLGSRYDSTPNNRVSFYITPSPPVTRVVADFAIITNPGSSFERRTDFNNNQDSVQIQSMLDQIKAELEKPAPPPQSAGPRKKL